MLRPFVEPKLHGNIFVKHFSTPGRVVDLIKLGEQPPVSGARIVDFKKLWIFLKIGACDGPR